MLTTSSLRSSQLHLDCTPTKGTLEQVSGLFAKERRNELREGRKQNEWAENINTTRTAAFSKCESAPRPPHADNSGTKKKTQPKGKDTQHPRTTTVWAAQCSLRVRQHQSFDSSSSPDVSRSMNGGPDGTSTTAPREELFPVAGGGDSRHGPSSSLQFMESWICLCFLHSLLLQVSQLLLHRFLVTCLSFSS